MKIKQALLSVAILSVILSAWAANPSNGVVPYEARFNEETYVMDITAAKAESGGKPTLVPGVIRHGRWVYSTADGTCEQLDVKLNGFILIPVNGGVVQQPDTTLTKTPVACPQQGS